MVEQKTLLSIINYLVILWSQRKIIDYLVKKSIIKKLCFYVDYIGIIIDYNLNKIVIKIQFKTQKCANSAFLNSQLPGHENVRLLAKESFYLIFEQKEFQVLSRVLFYVFNYRPHSLQTATSIPVEVELINLI